MRLGITLTFIFLAVACFSQSKIEKIAELLEKSDFNLMSETIVDGYMGIFLEQLDGNQEMGDSLIVWMASGYKAMKDSMVIFYDELFTEKDIDEMLVFYNTRVGQKMSSLTPKIMELSLRAGNNWGVANKVLLEEKIAPLVEKGNLKYTYESLYDPDETFKRLDTISYKTPLSSQSFIESESLPYSIHFDSLEWDQIDCTNLNTDADNCFLTKDKKIYSIVIAEDLQLDLLHLKAVALSNMYKATKEVVIKNMGLINVNNKEILTMKIEAKLNGIDIFYENYYISSEWGILQILTFCTKDDYDKSLDKMRAFNNGVVLR